MRYAPSEGFPLDLKQDIWFGVGLLVVGGTDPPPTANSNGVIVNYTDFMTMSPLISQIRDGFALLGFQ